MTQAELGEAVGSNRSQVNRIERGSADITRSLAVRLAEVLELPDLPRLFSERERSDESQDRSRDRIVARLLGRPDLQRVTIVVADDLDVYGLLYDSASDSALVDARAVDVVFPTVDREKELFDDWPIHSFVEYQIKRLATLRGGGSPPLEELRLFESGAVTASVVLARTRTETSCAHWAPLLVEGKPVTKDLPVAQGSDPTTAMRLENHVGALVERARPIRVNEALCRVEPVEGESGDDAPFTRYFEVGEDEEEEVGSSEGFALALVLAVARCPRRQYGMARRLITYTRPLVRHDRNRLSLFGKRVDATDVQRARALEQGLPPDVARSRGNALEAALDIDDYLTAHGGRLPDLAFQVAATRELRMFTVEVAPDRLRRVPLPPALRLVTERGARRAALAPRLFVLELGTAERGPELDALTATADVEALGSDDMRSEDHRLNDFLRQARDCGFLLPLLDELGVARR
jgi:transcriptional regulator with XRE-family HTH domain